MEEILFFKILGGKEDTQQAVVSIVQRLKRLIPLDMDEDLRKRLDGTKLLLEAVANSRIVLEAAQGKTVVTLLVPLVRGTGWADLQITREDCMMLQEIEAMNCLERLEHWSSEECELE